MALCPKEKIKLVCEVLAVRFMSIAETFCFRTFRRSHLSLFYAGILLKLSKHDVHCKQRVTVFCIKKTSRNYGYSTVDNTIHHALTPSAASL